MTDLSKEELSRYARHLSLPHVGIAGQKKLKNAKVLVVGAGGLGSPALLYLAAAGIGEIGIECNAVADLGKILADGNHARIAVEQLRVGVVVLRA